MFRDSEGRLMACHSVQSCIAHSDLMQGCFAFSTLVKEKVETLYNSWPHICFDITLKLICILEMSLYCFVAERFIRMEPV